MRKPRIKLAVVVLLLTALVLSGCANKNANQAKSNTPVRGVWEGSVFTSDYAKLTFTMPEGWVAATDEEIAALMNVTIDYIAGEGLPVSQEMMKTRTVYDMYAVSSAGTNVILAYENLSLIIGGSRLTPEAYLEQNKLALEQVGMAGVFSDYREVKVGGNTYTVLESAHAANGLTQYYFAGKQNNYMVLLLITTLGNDKLEDILNCFS